MEEFVLYIARDKDDLREYCRGSKMCMKIIEVLPSENINVQDCDMLRNKKVDFPAWLDGTPTLVSKTTGDIYKGTHAVKYMRELLEDYSQRRKKHEETKPDTPTPKEDDENSEEEEENYDAWADESKDLARKASSLDSQTKPTQQDVEEFMRQRQESMKQPDMNGPIPEIPQESS